MKQPLLSIGMIFRDDIRTLERCLQALEPLRKALPCELVMADTGSQDGSRAVAEEYADQVFDFPWVDDFSAARNAVMDRCSGKWYFTVDSDEYLDPDVAELTEFLTKPQKGGEYGASVVQRNYRTRDMLPGDYTDFLALRLLRMDTGIRYWGTIHESWGKKGGEVVSAPLMHVVLHHDGYAKDARGDLEVKMDRNLALLREELAREPDDMRRLIQCQDATIHRPNERWEYMLQGMELVKKMGEQVSKDPWAVVLYRNAVCMALKDNMPQAEEWLAWGEMYASESIFHQVDVTAAVVAHSYRNEDYETMLSWAERYQQGMAEYRAGRYNIQELSVTSLLSGTESICLTVTLAQCKALISLERKEKALELLEKMNWEYLVGQGDMVECALDRLASLAGEGDVPRQLCTRLLDMVWGKDEAWAKRVGDHAMVLANQLLARRHDSSDWQLLSGAPGDLGRAVQVAGLEQPEDITAALAKVEDWGQVPGQVLAHVVEHCAPFPGRFYEQGEEKLRAAASALGSDQLVREKLPLWAVCDPDPTHLAHRQFLFQCAAAALRSVNWEQEDGRGLVELWVQQGESYLTALYHPQVLARDGLWTALPGLHRCALHVIRAHQAGTQGDELGYVRELHKALEAAPAMKGAVEYLLDHMPKSEAQRQLEQLAGQVRAVLAQYAPDDPAVLTLKSSPAYQKVAHLLVQ